MLALIAGTVSYLHMHLLVELHGQPGWVAALTPLSVDGMIVAASTTLLAESRCGGRGGLLPWALLVAGSVASLAANVAVAEPTVTGRVIAAWPSFSLIAAYELLMRQVRRAAETLRPGGGHAVTRPGGERGASQRRRADRRPAPWLRPQRRLAGTHSWKHGGGLRTIGPRMARFPRAGTSGAGTVVTSDGVGWSSDPVWPEISAREPDEKVLTPEDVATPRGSVSHRRRYRIRRREW